ncbi:MAG TPA: DEAD/DEAH box helicase family protein [Solirubrobacteraceae bacterium]|nr:DEAD/DEAH box helicase family protein [Solirubrobacteraceae bacterium]
MAESTPVALAAAPIPSSADIARAEKFVHERFLHEGEQDTVALARVGGSATPRRRALDAALGELADNAKYPSTGWRREFSLLLGLERVLSEEEPRLSDGTVLSAHQVDALSGTLTALLAEAERSAGNGNGRAPVMMASPELLAAAEILGTDGPSGAENGTPAPNGMAERDAGAEQSEHEVQDEEEEELGDLEDELEPLPEEAQEEEAGEGDEEPRDWVDEDEDEALPDQPEDPNAAKRFWFEHATGAGKTVAALGFVEASQTGGILILTHRRNLVDQFLGELRMRGYSRRISRPLYVGEDSTKGPVSVETYQWFVRNAGRISSAYTIVICDEAHTALGEKTSGAIREWTSPIFIGMTATGALIARHVTDLFPTQTSRFDLAQAARRGVIAPLRCVRISPGVGVRTIAKVPLRRGEVDTEFDQEELAQLLDQQPFNLAMANLYKTRFNGVPGVVYAAGVRHAYNLAEAFRAEGIKAQGVSGETPKRELASVLARYERGEIDVLINAQLLAEGWNSPRATVCVHLAPTASKRIYQQRVGRVTRRHPGKEAGLVVDFVHPATKHDDPVVTLHSLLDRDVYRGGAIVVGPVRRGRGRRMRVERRVLPVCAEEERRFAVFERELWRIAVENLDYGEQHVWAALAGARVTATGWRRARAMLHFDRTGELKSRFLITAVQRNTNPQLRLRALADIAAGRDADAFDTAIDVIGSWTRDERREAAKIMLRALVERRIGRRDQASAWIWRLAEYTRDLHEEYAVQRWPETKRLLGLLVNSSGGAHARNARRLIHASRKQDRRLAAALLAAALAHTPEAEEALRGARTRMARKPPALARELLRNFPKRRSRNNKRKRSKAPHRGANPMSAPPKPKPIAQGDGEAMTAEAKTAVEAKATARSGAAEGAKATVQPGAADGARVTVEPRAAIAAKASEIEASKAKAAVAESPTDEAPSRAKRSSSRGGGRAAKAGATAKRSLESAAAEVKAASEAGADRGETAPEAKVAGEQGSAGKTRGSRSGTRAIKAKTVKPKATKAKTAKANTVKAKSTEAKSPEG